MTDTQINSLNIDYDELCLVPTKADLDERYRNKQTYYTVIPMMYQDQMYNLNCYWSDKTDGYPGDYEVVTRAIALFGDEDISYFVEYV